MIETYTYRTSIEKDEFQQTIYAKDVETSLQVWIERLKMLESDFFEKVVDAFKNNELELKNDKDSSFVTYRVDGLPKITYIEIVNRGKPDFIAKTRYLTTKEGGRKGFAFSGYRPHFQIEGKKEMTSAEQLFVDKDRVSPGETVVAEIRILWSETFENLLYPGLKFQLGEGAKIVADGEIIEVINEKLKKPAVNNA